MMVMCAGCQRPILDRFLLNVLDRAWHAKCVHCADCGSSLTEKCFSRDGKLFCREDFFRRYGTKCAGCSQGISPNDLVRKARNKVFHLKCFTCMVCRKQLSTGEELYVLDENKFICKDDYVTSKYNGSEHDDAEMEMDSSVLEKLDDLSDKSASIHDDDMDSRDSPALSGVLNSQHQNNMVNNVLSHRELVSPSLPDNAQESILDNSADSLGDPDSPAESLEVKQERNNNDCAESSTGDMGGENTSDNSSNKENTKDSNGNNTKTDKDDKDAPTGTKRRGPRTTIKAKQLEVLKAAFAATPKPTRHIREQLAQETGLNMRVIQVWFQNRRSKERRMKQLSALGARRQFFRNPRARMRGLRPGDELGDNPDMMGPGFNYFGDNGEFYPAYPGYPGEYFPGQGDPGNMNFMHPGPQGTPPLVDQPVPPTGPMDGQFMHGEMPGMPHNSSPEPNLHALQGHHEGPYPGGLPPRSIFPPGMGHPQEMQETW